MSGARVLRVRTTPTVIEWRDAILEAWSSTPFALPSIAALSVLWGQFALETARGKACFNWNLGNIKSVEGDGRDWCVLHTFEFINGQRVEMDDRFRSFPTLLEGARDYLAFLSRASYADPWSFVLAGDPEGFARALKRKGYYTASAEDYARGLKSLATEFTRISDAAPHAPIQLVCTTCHDPDPGPYPEPGLQLGDDPSRAPAHRLGEETAAERALDSDPETPTSPQTPTSRVASGQFRAIDLTTDPDGDSNPPPAA